MDFAFTPEQEELTRTLRAFARKELASRSRQWDKSGEFPWEAWRRMGELGLLGFRNPSQFGGHEIDLVSMGIAMEEIARGDFSATYGIQLAGLAGQILGQSGSDEVKARWLPPTARGESVIALALTEPGVGSDAANLACRAEREAFGRALATFEGVSFPIAEAATHIDAARWPWYRSIRLADQGLPHTKESAMVKWWAPKLSVETIHQCLLLHGHYGYTDELPFEQRLRDVIGLELGDGTAQIMKVIVARELMGRESLPYCPRRARPREIRNGLQGQCPWSPLLPSGMELLLQHLHSSFGLAGCHVLLASLARGLGLFHERRGLLHVGRACGRHLGPRSLDVLTARRLDILTARRLDILTARRLDILAARSLHVLTTRRLHVLTPRGLHVLTARRLDVLSPRGLHVLAARSLHILTPRRLDILTARRLDILTARRLYVLATRGLNLLSPGTR